MGSRSPFPARGWKQMVVSVLCPAVSSRRLFSSVTLLRSEGRNVLVDTSGLDQAGALMAALASHDLAQGHRHGADHALCTTPLWQPLAFPKARYVVSAEDMRIRRPSCRPITPTSPRERARPGPLRARHEVIKDYYLRSIVREVGRNWNSTTSTARRSPVPAPGGKPLPHERHRGGSHARPYARSSFGSPRRRRG